MLAARVAGEVGQEGGEVRGEAGGVGEQRGQLETRVEHDYDEDDVGGGEGDEFDAGLADEEGDLNKEIELVFLVILIVDYYHHYSIYF